MLTRAGEPLNIHYMHWRLIIAPNERACKTFGIGSRVIIFCFLVRPAKIISRAVRKPTAQHQLKCIGGPSLKLNGCIVYRGV